MRRVDRLALALVCGLVLAAGCDKDTEMTFPRNIDGLATSEHAPAPQRASAFDRVSAAALRAARSRDEAAQYYDYVLAQGVTINAFAGAIEARLPGSGWSRHGDGSSADVAFAKGADFVWVGGLPEADDAKAWVYVIATVELTG